MPHRPAVRSDLAVVELDGEAVIYDEESGKLHHLNPTATLVFALCDGTATLPELAADLANAFGIPLEEIDRQLRELVDRLRDEGLVVDEEASEQ